MKIKSVYCPHCGKQFEWFDPDVEAADIGSLIGSLIGGVFADTAIQVLARGIGIVLVGGWPGILLGLGLGGGMGRLIGYLFEPNTLPCPGNCPERTQSLESVVEPVVLPGQ